MAAIAERYNENGYYSVNSCARDVMLGSIPRFLGTRNRIEGLFMWFDNCVTIKNNKATKIPYKIIELIFYHTGM